MKIAVLNVQSVYIAPISKTVIIHLKLRKEINELCYITAFIRKSAIFYFLLLNDKY